LIRSVNCRTLKLIRRATWQPESLMNLDRSPDDSLRDPVDLTALNQVHFLGVFLSSSLRDLCVLGGFVIFLSS